MNGTGFASFSAAFQQVLQSMFPCTLVVGSTTVTAARSPWQHFLDADDIGGGRKEYRICRVRVLRSALGSTTVNCGVTTCTVDGTTAIVHSVSDIKNDDSLTLGVRVTMP